MVKKMENNKHSVLHGKSRKLKQKNNDFFFNPTTVEQILWLQQFLLFMMETHGFSEKALCT